VVGVRRVLDSAPLLDAVATQDTVSLIRGGIRGLLRVLPGQLATQVRAGLQRGRWAHPWHRGSRAFKTRQMTMASPTDGNHRNAMVGFCPRQTTRSFRAWRRRARSLLLPLELADPSAENSRPTPGGRYSRKTDGAKYHNQSVTCITDDRPR
jgi:hypothetical protein